MDTKDCIEMEASILLTRLGNESELLEWFRGFAPDEDKGYFWTRHPNLDKIDTLIQDRGHSGASFACTCRRAYSILNDRLPS